MQVLAVKSDDQSQADLQTGQQIQKLCSGLYNAG